MKFIDIPSGYLYGFPRPYDKPDDMDFVDWLVSLEVPLEHAKRCIFLDNGRWKIMKSKYQSYFDFKYEYYKRFPASTFRFGQAFLCKFVKDTGQLWKIWNEPDNKIAEDLVWKYIQDEGLDFNNLEIIND